MNSIFLLGFAGAFVTAGDIFLAMWARTSDITPFIIGLLLNIAGIIAYAGTLRTQQVGVATAAFLGLNIVTVAILGRLLYQEMPCNRAMLGMVIMIIAIILIEI
jgi:multidrug transporter EmrE-like cation transporter